MASIDQYEVYESRDEVKTNGKFEGERKFLVPIDDADTFKIDVAIGELWPGESGSSAPRVWRRRMRRFVPTRPGYAEIVALYRPPRWRRPDDTQLVRGVLLVDISGNSLKVLKDLDDKVIEGATENAGEQRQGIYQKVVTGDNTVLTPRTVFVIEALAKIYDPTHVETLVGKTNNNVIFYGHGPVGTIKFLGSRAKAPVTDDSDSFWEVRFNFLKHPNGWNNAVESQKFQRVPTKVQQLDEDGNEVTGMFNTVLRDQPLSGSSPESRRISETDDFTVFQNMLEL